MRRAGATVRWLAAAGVVAALLSSCGAARSDLGLSDGSCYVALPAAATAVHHHGMLMGVRLIDVPTLRVPAPDIFLAARSGGPRARVCLVGYRGQFSADQVARPRGRPDGPVAVVVLGYPGNQLLGTVILNHPPLHFGHSHLAG